MEAIQFLRDETDRPEQIVNKVSRTRSITRRESNVDRVLIKKESIKKSDLNYLVDTNAFLLIRIFYHWVNLVTIRTLRQILIR